LGKEVAVSILDEVRGKVRGRGARVVLAEGWDERAVRAAAWLVAEDLARPVLLGPEAAVRARAAEAGVALSGVVVRDPATDPELPRLSGILHELRRGKESSPEASLALARRPHYLGALLVHTGAADGLVSGLESATKPFLPAFQVVGLQEGFRRASSVFVMDWPDRTLFYADCSVNIDPDAATLAEIGRATAATARAFGIAPRVAFLSFSTRDSARHASIDRVQEAVALARAAEPDLAVDGELQFDAAFVPEVAQRKCPDSPLGGRANVFVFPDLNAGNIAYKITERLAGAQAVGPLLQGLRRPVHDVSRGCSVQDLADVATIAALQALAAG
jgi:phosphate acetyltransferase